MPPDGSVVVRDTGSEQEAELVAGALRSAGIEAAVIGGRYGGGAYGAIGLWQVIVHSEAVRDAREIIDAFESGTEG